MRSWKQILPFLILNIIVSAATTLAVLLLWDRQQSASLLPAVGGIPETQSSGENLTSNQTAAEATLPPLDQPVIVIETVIGAGDPENEVVVLKRVGEGELLLTNWKLSNSRGEEFVFPNLVLNKNGAVRLYTRAGTDTVIELFWNRVVPAWQSGDTVTLLDSSGNSRATYKIP